MEESTGQMVKYREVINKQKLQTLNLAKQLARTKEAKQKLSDRIREEAQRGDVSAVCSSLQMAHERGLLSGKNKVIAFIKTLTTNLTKKPQGKRYDTFSKSLYEVLKIWGGWRMARFVSMNLDGPADSTVKRITRRFNRPAEPGYQLQTLPETQEMYRQLMAENAIDRVLVEQAEDETVIVKLLQYLQAKDTVVGSCGQAGAHHKCHAGNFCVIGEDVTAFDRLKKFFSSSVIASMARVIMLNPLHPNLPATVIYLGPTCNKFTHHEVQEQWNKVQDIYNTHFLEIFKAPLTGKASDGDSRRRHAQLISAYSNGGEKFTIGHPNFTLTGKIEKYNQKICALNIMNQDYIHCGKKLMNQLDQTRRLTIGGHVAHINHLHLVMKNFEHQIHGLREEDVNRKDRQNWGSAQRMFFPKVQMCLRRLETGDNGLAPEDVKGTRLYLELCYKFVEIFCSGSASLQKRILLASHVVNFLRIWRWWVYRNPALNMKDHFVTKQTFMDVSLACHAAVLLMKAARDFTPDEELCLAKCGSDCCEDFFSQNGSWVMNRHNYTYGDMLMALPSMNRINQIRANPEAPSIPKGHKKQVNIWDRGHQQPEILPNMKAYPGDDEMYQAWDEGLLEAQRICTDIGKKT